MSALPIVVVGDERMSPERYAAAAEITAAALQQHQIDLTTDGAERVAIFFKHVLFYLDLHAPENGPVVEPMRSERSPLVRR